MWRQTMFAVCGWLAVANQAAAQDKIALVIGNDTYRTIEDVPAAHMDAGAVAARLESLGFDVSLIRNANKRYSTYSINQHIQRMQNADTGAIGFVYYDGHGVTIDGTNYLLPVDIAADSPDEIATDAIDVAVLLAPWPAESGKRSAVILDCCAINPFAQSLGMTGQGFAAIPAPPGNLVAFSGPADGATAVDSTFAQTLINAIGMPGASVQDALAKVNNEQAIFVASPIPDPIVLVAGATIAAPPSLEELAWGVVKQSNASADVMAFLEAYPDGAHAGDAKILLLSVLASELDANAPTPAPQDIAPVVAEVAPEIVDTAPATAVAFNIPLTEGAPEIVGKTIAQLIEGSPLFPPVEGLPESYWKTQQCSNCHQWEQANLCTQANSYLTAEGAVNLTKQHPYGGTFKRNLVNWAEAGCE